MNENLIYLIQNDTEKKETGGRIDFISAKNHSKRFPILSLMIISNQNPTSCQENFLCIEIRSSTQIFLLWNVLFGAPPGCCGGRHLERVVQEAVKTPVKPLDSPSGKALSLQSVANLFMGKCSKQSSKRVKNLLKNENTNSWKCMMFSQIIRCNYFFDLSRWHATRREARWHFLSTWFRMICEIIHVRISRLFNCSIWLKFFRSSSVKKKLRIHRFIRGEMTIWAAFGVNKKRKSIERL